MENEDVIRQEMKETRTSLTEKLETLEQQVVETVQGAKDAVTDTVETIKESVQETVGAVKDTVQGTVSTVKETVQDGMETVRSWFDIKAHVERFPWLMMGGSVLAGYWLGSMLRPASKPAGAPAAEVPSHEEVVPAAAPRPHAGNGHARDRKHGQAPVKKGTDLSGEFGKLKGLALGALIGTARDIILPSIPEGFRGQLTEIVDSITRKLGGEPVPRESDEPSRKEGGREETKRSEPHKKERFAF